MRVLCTYCSASKDPARGLVPAFKRYVSPRIVRVQEMAEREGTQFCILSGEFGLVDWNQPLPWYDHLLLSEEVPALAQMVTGQLAEKQITQVDFYTVPPKVDSNVVPYLNTIERACTSAAVELNVLFLEEPRLAPSPTSWKQIMESAAEARQLLFTDRMRGEAEFNRLLSILPDDGMIYFERGNGYAALGEQRLAKADLERAKRLFPLERWQWEAQEALNRLEQQIAEGGTLAEAQRRVSQMSQLASALRQAVRSAIDQANSQPASAGTGLRRALELVIAQVMRAHGLTPERSLSPDIRTLQNHSLAPDIVINHMDTIRILGGKAAHAQQSDQPALQVTDIYPMVTALVAVLDWWNEQQP